MAIRAGSSNWIKNGNNIYNANTSGNVVLIGVSGTTANTAGIFTAYVSSADIVTIKFSNSATGATDPASGTFRVSVIKY